MRKEFFMLLFIVALLFIGIVATTAPDVSRGVEASICAVDCAEPGVLVLKEPRVGIDINMSESALVSRVDEVSELTTESNYNSDCIVIVPQSERLCNCGCSTMAAGRYGRYAGDLSG